MTTHPETTHPGSRSAAAHGDVINGVRVAMVAKLVGAREDVTATAEERRIAKHVRRVGERLERKGYLPALRRKAMLDALRREAMRTTGEQNGR